MPSPKGFPEHEGWIAEHQAAVTSRVEPVLRCIAEHLPGGQVEACGTGVIVKASGVPAVLTADHVLDAVSPGRILLEAAGEFRPLDTGGALRDPSNDIALIPLPVDAGTWGLKALALDEQPSHDPAPEELEFYIASGFPIRDTKLDRKAEQLQLKLVHVWTFEADAAYKKLGLDRKTHIAVKYDRKNKYQDGRKVAVKKPYGMSGGALWRLLGPDDRLPDLRGANLAGVLLSFHEGDKKCLVATRIEVALELASALDRTNPG